MKSSPSIRLFSPINLVLLGLVICTILTGVAGQVWLRLQIEHSAAAIRQHEIALRDLNRQNDYYQSQIAQHLRPDRLMERIGVRLVRPDDQRVVWVRRVEGENGVASVTYTGRVEVAQNRRRGI